jgi:hypothetical protein
MLVSIDKTYNHIETDNISFGVEPSYCSSSLMSSFWTNVGSWKYLFLLDNYGPKDGVGWLMVVIQSSVTTK